MQKWEYLTIETAALVYQSFQHYEVDGGFDIAEERGYVMEELTLNRLGDEGWEAYSRDQSFVHLKRLKRHDTSSQSRIKPDSELHDKELNEKFQQLTDHLQAMKNLSK